MISPFSRPAFRVAGLVIADGRSITGTFRGVISPNTCFANLLPSWADPARQASHG